jgi:thiamine biosynthesis lipoprotein
MTTALAPAEVADHTFPALGTDVRILVEGPYAAELVRLAEVEVRDYDMRLSRFRPDSELCRLNANRRERVPASALLREAVRASLRAAQRSDGLVDPCVLDALERAGYTTSLAPTRGRPAANVPLPASVAAPARPHPARLWSQVRVDDEARTVVRPRGLRLDLGGSGKGHAADRVARLLEGNDRFVVDCGGDVRVGGDGRMQEVLVAHPFGGMAGRFELAAGAVATSSVLARAWLDSNARPAHHLIDPASGAPAWAGVVAATAVGRTTLEAETLAKVAVLSGPREARRVLAEHGGLFIHPDGRSEEVR